jgi:hypothetical protein
VKTRTKPFHGFKENRAEKLWLAAREIKFDCPKNT